MNLEPKLAQEIFGNKYRMKPKSKSKTSGYHSGDVIIYRDQIKGQILDKMDDYVQVSWPINKPIYQRAILWCNVADIKRKENKKNKDKNSLEKKGYLVECSVALHHQINIK